MKLTSFIKAYKVALSNLGPKVEHWQNVYLGCVDFPNESNQFRIVFTFSSGYLMSPGDLGITAAVSLYSIEQLKGGLDSVMAITNGEVDKDTIARKYIERKEKINECGRVVVLLETLLNKVAEAEPDTWRDASITDMSYNFDQDTAMFCVNGVKIYTDGCLILLGE